MTATVSAASASLAGSMVTSLTMPLSVSTGLLGEGAPRGLRAALCTAPVFGGGRRRAGDGGGVRPAGGGGGGVLGGAFGEDAERGGTGAEGGGDARSQAVAGGSTDDQDPFRAVFDRALGLHMVDLLLDVRGATRGV